MTSADDEAVPALAVAEGRSALNPNGVTERIEVDADGLSVADGEAEAAALEELRRVLGRYDGAGCRVGFALITGHGADVAEGIALARATELLLRREFPELFGGAASESLAVPDAVTRGQIELRLFFYGGCAPSAETPTARATAPATMAPTATVASTPPVIAGPTPTAEPPPILEPTAVP